MEVIIFIFVIIYVVSKALGASLEDPTKEKQVTSQESHQSGQWQNTVRENIQKVRQRTENTSIVQRAKMNTDTYKKDVTLETMEEEHNHSERVSAAEHHHPEDILAESMLGSVEDLMVKGFDGNLCFERDFVGEGLDMISRFTVPSDVPDFS